MLQNRLLLAAAPRVTFITIARISKQRATICMASLAMLRAVLTALHSSGQFPRTLKPTPVLMERSSDQGNYCAIYRYASGSRGYGCAAQTDYNVTVLTVTSSSVVQPTASPFGHDPSTTSTASTSQTVEASSTTGTGLAASNSATPVPVMKKSMSGGAIAGIVIGSVLGVVAILLILLLLFQRHRKVQAKQRHENQTSRGPYPLQDQRIYDQYGKLIYSPPWSPRSHSRHQSDVQSELHGVPVSPDPTHKGTLASSGISEVDGSPFSPETIRGSPLMSHEFSDAGQQNRPAELPGVD